MSLVDAVGGVNINVTDGFCDPRYKEYGIKGFNITPGRYHFDGEEALAYARVRKAAGESDFTRAARQQEVIARPPRPDRPRRAAGATRRKFLQGVGETIQHQHQAVRLIADYIDVASEVEREDVFRDVMTTRWSAAATTTGARSSCRAWA